jgi:hypothetical protein
MKFFRNIFFLILFFSPLWAELSSSHLLHHQDPTLVINNRPLAKINGKIISLIDVVKKMDLFLQEYAKDFPSSNIDRYQFYIRHWESTLEEMINTQLILLDSEKRETQVNDGKVREELEERFGPSIMKTLENVNMLPEEAKEMIRADLIVKELMWFNVHAKAMQAVTPALIKETYLDYLEKNPPQEKWNYQVLSVRGKDKELSETIAKKAYLFLTGGGKELTAISEELQKETSAVSIHVSDDFSSLTQDLSTQHYQVLKTLTPNSYSEPIPQVSRYDKTTVFRVFYLKSLETKTPPPLDEMHETLKNQLLNKISDKEKEIYIKTLKKRFGFDQDDAKYPLPEDYQPFSLQT